MREPDAALLERLSERPSEADVEAARALDPEQRGALVRALKQELDQRVRSRPADAVPLAHVLVRCGEGLGDPEALALRGLGTALHFTGDGAGAVEVFERACELYEREGAELEAATVRRSLVDILQMLGRAEEALAAAELAREPLARLGAERTLGQLEVNVGNVHMMRLDDHATARVHYRRARETFARLGDAFGRTFAEFNLGVCELYANRLDESEELLRSGRAGFDELEMEVHVADADYHLAYLESRRGRFATAVHGLRELRVRYQALSKPDGVAMCDLDLAEVFLRLDARREALDHAAAARTRYAELGMEHEAAQSEALWGRAALALGEAADEGRAALRRASEGFRRVGSKVLAAYYAWLEIELCGGGRAADDRLLLRRLHQELVALDSAFLSDVVALSLARAELGAGHHGDAGALLAGLVERDFEDPVDALTEIEARQLMADLHASAGDEDAARAELERAVERVDSCYARVPGADRRLAFFRRPTRVFIELARRQLSDSAGLALRTLERGRGRSLREASPPAPTASKALIAARERLEWLVTRRLDASLGLAGPDDGPVLPPPGADELRAAQEDLLRLRRLERGDDGSLPAEHEISTAVPKDACGLSYLTTEAGVAVLLATEEGVEAVELPIDLTTLTDLCERLSFHVQRLLEGSGYVRDRRSDVSEAFEHLFDELGARLVEPALRHAAGRRLVVVPAGPLHGVPFQALRVHGRPLIADRDVSYALSLTHLATLRRRPAPSPEAELLVCAEQREDLPQLEREAELHESVFGDRSVRVAPAEFASFAGGRRTAPAALHVAGHGLFDARHPELSALVSGNQVLFAEDLRGLTAGTPLVTLSGCETARHGRRSSEELVGLPRAFLQAGCAATVGSLWPVPDDSVVAFFERFFTELSEGRTAGAALGAAQRALASAGQPHESWVPFSLYGDPDVRVSLRTETDSQ